MIESALKEATKIIPIYWPLPSFIATNPLWDEHEAPLQEVLYNLKDIAGVEGVMPLSFYQALFNKNKLETDDLVSAIEEYLKENTDAGSKENLKKTLMDFNLSSFTNLDLGVSRLILVAEKLSRICNKAIHEEIQKNILSFLMRYFSHTPMIENSRSSDTLFHVWHQQVAHYNNELVDIILELETNSWVAADHLLNEFKIPPDERVNYLKKIFYSVLGWSSLIKWLEQRPDNPYFKQPAQLIDLVLIWLCYEKYFYRKNLQPALFQNNKEHDNNQNRLHDFKYRFIWQRASEIAYERQLMNKLTIDRFENLSCKQSKPLVQAIFCIDTRSEGIRRHLEKRTGYETFGFAGFFGFVFNYQNNLILQPFSGH